MAQGKVEICGVNTAKLPILKEEEKEALFARIKAGDAQAKEEYIKGNLRLVLSVIKRFSASNENPDDLFQIGCIGLIKAINNFNIDLDVKFSTYAVPMKLTCRERCKGVWRMKWTKETVIQAVEEYRRQHGKLPQKFDLTKANHLPSHTVFKYVFGLTVLEFYKTYFKECHHLCDSAVYGYRTSEYWLNDFKTQYLNLRCSGKEQYDNMRRKGTPCASHLLKITGIRTWTELLRKCEIYPNTYQLSIKEISLSPDSIYALNERLDEILP